MNSPFARPTPRHLAPVLAALTLSCPPLLASSGGSQALLSALDRVLPSAGSEQALRVGKLGIELAFGAPLKAVGLAEEALLRAATSGDQLDRALATTGEQTAAGPTHRALEVRQVELGEVGRLLTSLASAAQAAAGRVGPGAGTGGLASSLALDELMRQAEANLLATARAAHTARGRAERARRAVSRMLAFVETLQDADASTARARVRIGGRRGALGRLRRGVQGTSTLLRDSTKAFEQTRSLMRVRYLASLEALRNLSSGTNNPKGLRTLDGLEAALAGARESLALDLGQAQRRLAAWKEGRELLPEIPVLPDWLFSAGRQGGRSSPEPIGPASDVFALLDEIEQEMDDGDEAFTNPLTATLAEGFRDRHQLPARPEASGLPPGYGPGDLVPEVASDFPPPTRDELGDWLEASARRNPAPVAADPELVDEVAALFDELDR